MDLFIARQPIFTVKQAVYAYELLFRSGPANVFPDVDHNHASARVIADSLFNLGLQTLTGGKLAFINMTRDLLLGDYAVLLPRDETVIEVLETVTPDAKVVEACRRLKAAGYLIALDDFVGKAEMAPLVALADIIKVDFLATRKDERRALVKRYAPRGVRLLAEKVETQEGFREAADLGYTYFQGYFFAKPAVMQATAAPEFRLTYLTLLQETVKPDLDLRRIAAVIGRDVTLSYKLLRFINSAFFGLRRSIASIPEALSLLGEREVKRWASLLGLACLGANKPAELVVEAALRARFCEGMAAAAGLAHYTEELFLLGLFSLIDAILDRPLESLLQELPIPSMVKATLLGEASPLKDVYDCVLAYVAGDWESLSTQMDKLQLDEEEVPRRYREAVAWAQQALRAGDSTNDQPQRAPALARS
ncbi:MAG: HDOD domain-containing protein [candidate division NC10 bacterium]|nr:HDOD domain-containing protein [candidate division NC10 bacterium]